MSNDDTETPDPFGPEYYAGVKTQTQRLFEEAHREAATKANIERIIMEAFASVGEPEPGATLEELARREGAIFEHMWRGFGCNVLPFPERTASNSTTSTSPEGDAA